eukprot:Nk52_evm6s250 gene=Nk52_evmTU6s250
MTILKTGTAAGQHELSQTNFLEGPDVKRIQTNLCSLTEDMKIEKESKEERERLYGLSKNMVKSWDNTINGQRLKKLAAREKRLEQEEEERVKVDIEEAKIQKQNRIEKLENANKLVFYKTDRVKKFHSGLLLSDCLKERDAQIKYKKERATADKEREKVLIKKLLDTRTFDNEKLKKIEEAAQKKVQVRKDQMEQIAAKKKIKEAESLRRKEEGKKILADVEEYLQEEALKEQKRKDEANLTQQLRMESMEESKRYKELQRQADEDMDNEIATYALQKERMMQMRRNKEREKIADVTKARQRMVDKMYAEMMNSRGTEEKRIENAAKEYEEKADSLHKAKLLKQKEMMDEINHYRHLSEERKALQAREKKEQEIALLEERMKEFEKFKSDCAEKKRLYYLRCKALETYHFHQMNRKRTMTETEKMKQFETDFKNIKAAEDEEQRFLKYALAVIDEWKKAGKNTNPMESIVYPRAALKRIAQWTDTKKRMGFVDE